MKASFLKSFLVSIVFFLTTACVTEMPGKDATEINPPASHEKEIDIALAEIKSLESDQYRAYNVSVRNNTDRWLRLEKINIEFPGLATQPEVLLGSDLASYAESIERRNNISDLNTRLVLDTVIAGGSIAALTSGGSRMGLATGLGAIVGAATYGSVKEVLDSKARAEFQNALPERHLLKPFDIAPGLVLARWIIVHIPKTIDVEEARIYLSEKDQAMRSFAVDGLSNRLKPVAKKTGH